MGYPTSVLLRSTRLLWLGMNVVIFGCSAGVHSAPGQQADLTPPLVEANPPQASANDRALTAFELESQTELQVKISLNARRLPFNDLLAELEKQSGIKFKRAPGVTLLNTRVTVHVKEMPLWDVLGALGRLYGIRWSNQGNRSFTLDWGLDELHRHLLRVSGYDVHLAEPTIRPDWAKDILPHIHNTGALRSPQGVQLSSLPGDLQQSIREKLDSINLGQLVQDYQRFLYPTQVTPHYMLHIGAAHGNPQAEKYSLTLVNPDGRVTYYTYFGIWSPSNGPVEITPDHQK